MPLTLTNIQSEAEAQLKLNGTNEHTTRFITRLLLMAYNLGRLDRTQEVLDAQLHRANQAAHGATTTFAASGCAPVVAAPDPTAR